MHIINLGYTYEAAQVFLRGEYTFYPGDLVHITGRNGSGKSTILKIFAGILGNYTGTCKLPPNWSARYVPTNISSALFLPWYSVRKNIELLVGAAQARSHDLCHRFLNSTFDRILDQPAYTPSAGESAAIAIACAVAANPYAILLDETLSHAAAALAKELAEVLEAFLPGRLLFVAGHHELPFAAHVRIVAMDDPHDKNGQHI